MKTKLSLLFMLISIMSYAQVPSVNINTNFSSTFKTPEEITKINEINILENKLKEEIENSKKGLTDNQKKTKQDSLKILELQKNKIIENTFDYKFNTEYYNDKISKINLKIEKLKKDINDATKDENRNRINTYSKEVYLLNKQIELLNVEKNRTLNPRLNNYNWWLPSKNPTYRNAFFEDTYNNTANKANYLNAFSIIGSPNGITGQSEIVTDNIKMVRITFGTIITATNDSLTNESTRVDALQRLLNGGGNFYFDFTLPLATTIKGNDEDELINFYAYTNIKLASDVKGYGNNIEASTYNSSLGLNLYGDISSENRKFNFFFIGTSNYYYLSTKEFYKNLNIDHSKGFLSGKITIGVTLINQFRFSANVLTYGSEPSVRSEKIVFGLQFLPAL